MIITELRPRRKGLSALYIDGEFVVNLDTETLIVNNITVGSEIDYDDLEKITLQSDKKRCKEKALWLIQYRDHTEKELIDKLRREYPLEISQETADKMIELGLINDRSYAQRYAHDLVNLRGLSRKGVRQKLISKGVDKDLIEEVLDEIDIDEDSQIRDIIERKYLKDLDTDKGRMRAVNSLMRMGYSYSDIKSALYEYTED